MATGKKPSNSANVLIVLIGALLNNAVIVPILICFSFCVALFALPVDQRLTFLMEILELVKHYWVHALIVLILSLSAALFIRNRVHQKEMDRIADQKTDRQKKEIGKDLPSTKKKKK